MFWIASGATERIVKIENRIDRSLSQLSWTTDHHLGSQVFLFSLQTGPNQRCAPLLLLSSSPACSVCYSSTWRSRWTKNAIVNVESRPTVESSEVNRSNDRNDRKPSIPSCHDFQQFWSKSVALKHQHLPNPFSSKSQVVMPLWFHGRSRCRSKYGTHFQTRSENWYPTPSSTDSPSEYDLLIFTIRQSQIGTIVN